MSERPLFGSDDSWDNLQSWWWQRQNWTDPVTVDGNPILHQVLTGAQADQTLVVVEWGNPPKPFSVQVLGWTESAIRTFDLERGRIRQISTILLWSVTDTRRPIGDVAEGAPLISEPVGRPTITPEAIRAIRTRHSLSQDQFAGRLGVSVRTVQHWEQGTAIPGADRVVAMHHLAAEPEARAPQVIDQATRLAELLDAEGKGDLAAEARRIAMAYRGQV